MTLGDRVVVMKDGTVQQVGEPLEVYSRPANKFVAGFIGSPAMNFIDTTITEAAGGLYLETTGLRVKVPPERAARLASYREQGITLGIRPEDLREARGGDAEDLSFDAVVDVVEPLDLRSCWTLGWGARRWSRAWTPRCAPGSTRRSAWPMSRSGSASSTTRPRKRSADTVR